MRLVWNSCTPVRLKFIQLPNTSEVFPSCQICQGTLVSSRHYFPSPWTDAGRRLAPMRRLWTWPDEMDDIWNHPIPWAKRFWRFEDSNGLEVIFSACHRVSQNHPQDSIVTSLAGLVAPQDPRHQRQSFRWDLREEDREMGHTWAEKMDGRMDGLCIKNRKKHSMLWKQNDRHPRALLFSLYFSLRNLVQNSGA